MLSAELALRSHSVEKRLEEQKKKNMDEVKITDGTGKSDEDV